MEREQDIGPAFKHLHSELLKFSNYRLGAVRRLGVSQLTPSWFKNNGTFRPVHVPSPQEGTPPCVKFPVGALSPDSLAALLGPNVAVQTLDVAAQSDGPRWNLQQWELYWRKRTAKEATGGSPLSPSPAAAVPASSIPAHLAEDEEADSREMKRRVTGDQLKGISSEATRRALAVPALSIAGTSLDAEAPAAVRAVSLHRSLGLPDTVPSSDAPILIGMHPKKTFLNFMLGPAGAAVWFHVVSGTATLALIPPTPANLAAFAAWARDPLQRATFLAAKCEGAARADLSAGDTLLLPPGWSYALAVTSSAVSLSGASLRADCLAVHLDAMCIEQYIGVLPNSRWLSNVEGLMWHVAAQYARVLGESAAKQAGCGSFEPQVAARAAEMERKGKAAAVVAAAARQRERAAAEAAAVREAAAKAAANAAAAKGRRGGGCRQGRSSGDEVGGRKRRRAAPDDSFIASELDESAELESGDDEGEWAPTLKEAALEEGEDGEEEFSDEDFSDDGELGGGGLRRKRKSQRTAGGQIAGAAAASIGVQRATRHKGRLPGRLAEALHAGEQGEEEELEAPLTAPKPAVKLKIKLPGAHPPPTAPTPAAAGGGGGLAPPSRIKLKFSTIPQVDGAGDEEEQASGGGGCGGVELSEGEEQGLTALLSTLSGWLSGSTPSLAIPPVPRPWEVLARLEVSMKVLGIPLEPPPGTALGGELPGGGIGGTSVEEEEWIGDGRGDMVSAEGDAGMLGAPGGYENEEEGGDEAGETLLDGASGWGENDEMVSGGQSTGKEDSPVPKKRAAPIPKAAAARRVPGQASRGGVAKKKLSTKDRLKKKLGI